MYMLRNLTHSSEKMVSALSRTQVESLLDTSPAQGSFLFYTIHLPQNVCNLVIIIMLSIAENYLDNYLIMVGT